MLDLKPNISISTLNVNDLNTSIMKQKFSDGILKARPNYMNLSETKFNYKDIYRLKVRWKNIYHTNTNHKKAGVAILISMQISEQRMLTGTKKTFYDDIWANSSSRHKILNIYAPNKDLQNT